MRLFVAIFPPPAAVADLEQALDRVRPSSGLHRWQPPQRWHLTLAFLGQVTVDGADRVRAAMAALCPQLPAPRLQLASCGMFRVGRGAGVVWVGVNGDGVGQLARRVGAAILPGGSAPAYRPHLTVARWRPPERPDGLALSTLSSYAGPGWIAGEAELVRSHLGPQPRYERIGGWAFAGAVELGAGREQTLVNGRRDQPPEGTPWDRQESGGH